MKFPVLPVVDVSHLATPCTAYMRSDHWLKTYVLRRVVRESVSLDSSVAVDCLHNEQEHSHVYYYQRPQRVNVKNRILLYICEHRFVCKDMLSRLVRISMALDSPFVVHRLKKSASTPKRTLLDSLQFYVFEKYNFLPSIWRDGRATD